MKRRDACEERAKMRRIMLGLLLVAACAFVPGEGRAGENVPYSVIFPGWGQIRAGHYGRGALFMSGELVALTTLAIADIQYDRTVEQYDRAKAAYLGATYIGDAVYAYTLMNERWNSAEDLQTVRETALYAAIGIWVVNIADIVFFDGEGEPPLSISARPGGFLVTGALSF
jgi:hypothetical protein